MSDQPGSDDNLRQQVVQSTNLLLRAVDRLQSSTTGATSINVSAASATTQPGSSTPAAAQLNRSVGRISNWGAGEFDS